MTSQPSQSALDAETEAGIRARTGIVALTRRLVVSDSDAIADLIEEADNDRRVLLAEIDRLRSFEDWGRRWVAAADVRAGMRVVIGETPPWHTVTTARALNDELRALLAAGASPSTAEETPE